MGQQPITFLRQVSPPSEAGLSSPKLEPGRGQYSNRIPEGSATSSSPFGHVPDVSCFSQQSPSKGIKNALTHLGWSGVESFQVDSSLC